MTGQELNTLVGENIKYYRKRKGLTQKELGRQVGIANNCICNYECGKNFPGCSTLSLLAFVLGVDVWRLFYDREMERGNDG
jgi:repressor LexA